MTRIITILTVTISVTFFSCGQNSQKEKMVHSKKESFRKLEYYIDNPAETDSMCLKSIAAAKADIANGKLVFFISFDEGKYQMRQEKQLMELCKFYHLELDYELTGCVIYEGQTQGCYGAYMGKIIEQKYGKGFIKMLFKKADSLLVESNDTVLSYYCDKLPQIPGRDVEEGEEANVVVNVPKKFRESLKADSIGDFPFMDIGFYIDRSGNASGYFLDFFNDVGNVSNQKLQDDLYKLGISRLKKIKRWEPGLINGQRMITEHNVRVYFVI